MTKNWWQNGLTKVSMDGIIDSVRGGERKRENEGAESNDHREQTLVRRDPQ